jgi:hypothetical protein
MKTDITIVYQKIIDERRYKISYRKAIYANAHGDVAQLKNDLKNSIFHVFGNHQKCTVHMCDKVGDLARNRTAVLTETCKSPTLCCNTQRFGKDSRMALIVLEKSIQKKPCC